MDTASAGHWTYWPEASFLQGSCWEHRPMEGPWVPQVPGPCAASLGNLCVHKSMCFWFCFSFTLFRFCFQEELVFKGLRGLNWSLLQKIQELFPCGRPVTWSETHHLEGNPHEGQRRSSERALSFYYCALLSVFNNRQRKCNEVKVN